MLLIGENKVSEVICLHCLKRWKACRAIQTRLYDLECPYCSSVGFVIETGETSTCEELLEMAREGQADE